MTFDLDDIDGLIDYLDDYSKSLDEKALHISERLAELGISVAQRESGSSMGKYLIFGKEVANGTVLFYGTQTGVITSTWKTRDGWVSADISPLLMCEFGSGQYANNPFDTAQDIGGQGTFPGQTHAFDPEGWNWLDDHGWHHSDGLRPNQPIYKASLEMIKEIESIAKEVFNVG